MTSLDFLVPLLIGGTGMGMIFAPLFDFILGEVADHEVGSASSTLQAVQQLGMSLGFAVIGTVFFGLLGAQAHHNFDTATAPRLRTELVRAGVPAPAQAQIVAGLRACVHDRETEKDPDVVPTSCRATGGSASQAVVRALTTAGLDTHRRDSLDAAETTALVTIGLIVLAFGLGFLLPKTARAEAAPA